MSSQDFSRRSREVALALGRDVGVNVAGGLLLYGGSSALYLASQYPSATVVGVAALAHSAVLLWHMRQRKQQQPVKELPSVEADLSGFFRYIREDAPTKAPNSVVHDLCVALAHAVQPTVRGQSRVAVEHAVRRHDFLLVPSPLHTDSCATGITAQRFGIPGVSPGGATSIGGRSYIALDLVTGGRDHPDFATHSDPTHGAQGQPNSVASAPVIDLRAAKPSARSVLSLTSTGRDAFSSESCKMLLAGADALAGYWARADRRK